MSAEPVVRFDNVDIVFGNKPTAALRLIDEGRTREEIREATGQILGVAGCSIDVHEGEIMVLMGLSGSGKSTLLRAVNGLNPVTRGQVLVHDGAEYVDPGKCSVSDLRSLRMHRVTMVFQQFALLPWRTVEENVAYGLEVAEVAKAESAKRVAEQLELVGLSGWGQCTVDELSGGMMQRVGLARAFVTEAPILLMDEPYSALDPLIRANLQDELIDLQQQLKRTIIFVSHDLDEAVKIGSRIAIMDGGRIVQIGTPQEIVLTPTNDYVAEFVAQMNPLNVLRAREVMRQVAPRPAPEAAVFVEADRNGADPASPLAALPETAMRALIEAYLERRSTVLVIAEGQVVGEIGEAEILGALVR